MASKGKKGKKSKWEKIPLTDFIPETPGGMPAMPIKVTSWADEVDDDNDIYTSRKPQEPVVLPTAPRAARGPGVDEENIPTNPPFVAYVSNLPYDVLEEDLEQFFADMQVTNMRLPKDTNRPKGYGYVDFEDRQSLIDALSLTNTTIKGRRVRIEVSNSNSEDRRGRMGMNRDYGRRDNYDDADRNSDWRSGPRDEPSGDNDRFRSRGGGFDKDRREERDSSASDNRPGAWREGRAPLPDLPDRGGSSFSDRRGFRSDDKDREFSRFGDRGSRDREGSDRGDRGGDRGERGGGSSFGPRRNFGGDRDRDRDRDRNFGGDRESDWGNRLSSRPPTAEPAAPAEARTRVKLNLQPRTKPIDPLVVKDDGVEEKAESEGDTPAAAPAPTPVPAANIFGAAKPVDTTAREREIEERLAKKAEEGERKVPPREGGGGGGGGGGERGERGERGGWVKRNGEGRSENERDRPRPAWRSEEDRERQVDRPAVRHPPGSGRSDGRNDSRGPPPARTGSSAPRGGPKPSEARGMERERKERREDGVPPMPKATDDPAPNFVASNMYSMLHEEVDADASYD